MGKQLLDMVNTNQPTGAHALGHTSMQVSEDAADTSAGQRLREQVVQLKVANGMLETELKVGVLCFSHSEGSGTAWAELQQVSECCNCSNRGCRCAVSSSIHSPDLPPMHLHS
jgi:hypothetical protein